MKDTTFLADKLAMMTPPLCNRGLGLDPRPLRTLSQARFDRLIWATTKAEAATNFLRAKEA